MSSTALTICLTPEQLRMSGSALEMFLLRYLYPLLCGLGCVGNAMNLSVLLSRSMRSRANNLLAALAVADTCFLLLMLPHSLASYDIFAFNYTFRNVYLNAKMHLLAIANWSSAAAIWFVIAVCTERLNGIRRPLHSRNDWTTKQTILILITIVSFTGALTFYNHLSHDCIFRHFCNNTQIFAKCFPVTSETWYGNNSNPHSYAHRNYIKYSMIGNVIFVIVFPIMVLMALNAMLIVSLKKRSKLLMSIGNNSFRIKNADYISHQKTEHRVTITVCAIVTAFTVTQGPSAAAAIYQSLYGAVSHSHTILYVLTTATSFLVVLGKTLNFILFCLSSANFRHRLLAMMKRRLHRNRQDSAFSMSSRITHDTPMQIYNKHRLSMSTIVCSQTTATAPILNNSYHHNNHSILAGTPPSSAIIQQQNQLEMEPLVAIVGAKSITDRRRSSGACCSKQKTAPSVMKMWHRLPTIDHVLDTHRHATATRRPRAATTSGSSNDRRSSLLPKQSISAEAAKKRKSIV